MNRDRAVDLAVHLLRNLHARQLDWPLSIITEVYVFGSFARGALTPNDLDINLEYERTERWRSHFVSLVGSGRDLYAPIRKELTAGRRGYQFTFDSREHPEFEMTLLWRRGDNLEAALERLHAIKADPSAGRAPRDSMLPQFEGIDEWIPRSYREALFSATESGIITVERIVLPDIPVASGVAGEHIAGRWGPASPLYRAAPMPLLVGCEPSFRVRAAAGMMAGMHPWIGLSADVRLGVLTEWVTPELVDEVLAECGVRDQKPGALPARFMVYYVLALALFQQDSYDDVAENLVGALEGMDGAVPNKSSFTRARQRLGAGALEAVFRRLAGPAAPAGLEGAFWRGMRVAAVDGFVLDVPDTPVNRATFGGPVDAKGRPAGFPQARVVTLTETGTHASVGASVGGFCGGEPELAIAMAGSAAGMLVIMDRGFPGVALWKAYTQAGAHLLIRARSSVAHRPVKVLDDGTYLARMNLAGQKGAHPGGVLVRVIEYRVDGGEVIRLLTDLLDPAAFPAGELAALYHQRWESESTFRQVKTFQRGPQEILRSADPELVRQEIWAHLAVHHCLTAIIMRLAGQERIDPDRISFVKVLKHVRRSVIRQSAEISAQIRQFTAMMAAKVRRKLDNGARRLREADRFLKRPDSKYSFRKAGQVRRPTRRVAAKVLTLHPAIVQ